MRRLSIVLLLAAPCAWAERVVLKNGGVVSGVVVARDDARVVLDVGPGRIGIPMSSVARIEGGTSTLAQYREQAAQLALGDAEGWAILGHWARERGLETQALAAFEQALEADPSHAGAHRALGHVRSGDIWLTRDESYRSRGFIHFEGGWITPAEREVILEERAASNARDQARREAEARAREAEARAREAEAEARRIESERAAAESGLPYWWVVGGGGCSGWGCGYVKPTHHGRPHHGSAHHGSPPTLPVPPAPEPQPAPTTTGSMR